MRIINTLFIIILLSASIRHGSCTPTRIILDGNARDLAAPASTVWDPRDTYRGLFSPRTPQFDMYRPTMDQLRNFGSYAMGQIGDDRLFSPRTPQFDMYRPTMDQLRNLGYAMGQSGDGRLRTGFSNPPRPSRILATRCENLDDVKKRNFLMSFGLGTGVRCSRTIREWTLQEPLYVDEPGWVSLEIKGDGNEDPGVNGDDPFIMARGKRLIDKIRVDSANVPQTSSSKPTREVRRSEGVNMNGEADESMKSFYRGLEKYLAARSGYVQPRDKHSDVMDILNEPFFISRGKKSRGKKNDFQGITNLEFHSTNSPGNYRSIRDRRGEIVEQLLKEQDPFYIARGKRSANDLSALLRDWKK
ncbi:uncharacterized protein LOC107039007 isoform X3 [Diachasma alloeum]|uniref:uncharacterized protein LOC107039007 isoform X3 n=1 Tax=Diachasma alloeum TaxID=454923 RepID=UPI0007384528|nr:uncharacterized protein LOC107039007 isoform X3 [Diachasma alloeum]